MCAVSPAPLAHETSPTVFAAELSGVTERFTNAIELEGVALLFVEALVSARNRDGAFKRRQGPVHAILAYTSRARSGRPLTRQHAYLILRSEAGADPSEFHFPKGPLQLVPLTSGTKALMGDDVSGFPALLRALGLEFRAMRYLQTG